MLPFHPLANIFPLMEGADYSALVEDIRRHGLREPIVVLDGLVLDGRNRLRACEDAGAAADTVAFTGDDPVAYVVSANLRRRHLSESQRAVCGAKLANVGRGGDRRSLQDQTANLPFDGETVSNADAAGLLNVSERSIRHARTVVDSGAPALLDKVVSGEVAVSVAADVARLPAVEQQEVVARGEAAILQAASRIKAERSQAGKVERAAKIAAAAQTVPARSARWDLRCCGVLDLMREPAGSVDVICTDPPYPQEFLPLFGDLAAVAVHLLKPGGVLLCMSGQTWLPQVLAALDVADLSYHWTIAYLTPGGQATQIFPRRVNAFWKPVLVFTKGEFAGDWFGDVARSEVNDNDKTHHEWGQSESGMLDLMRRFVRPGHVVVDPFLGGGTTAVVALDLGARFLGCDIDEDAVTTTRGRLADAVVVG